MRSALPIAESSTFELILWVVVALVWSVMRLLQRKMSKGKPVPPPVASPAGEPRDLEDFLRELFDQNKAAPAEGPSVPAQEPAGDISIESVTGAERSAPVMLAPPAEQAPVPRPMRRQPRPADAESAALMGAPADMLRAPLSLGRAGLLRLPAMQPCPAVTRSPHPLTAGVKTPAGLRQVVLGRELIGPARALRPYF